MAFFFFLCLFETQFMLCGRVPWLLDRRVTCHRTKAPFTLLKCWCNCSGFPGTFLVAIAAALLYPHLSSLISQQSSSEKSHLCCMSNSYPFLINLCVGQFLSLPFTCSLAACLPYVLWHEPRSRRLNLSRTWCTFLTIAEEHINSVGFHPKLAVLFACMFLAQN